MIDRRLPIRGKLRYHATARAISEVLLCKYAVRVSQRDIYAGMISTLGGYRHKGSDPGALAKELGVFPVTPVGGRNEWHLSVTANRLFSFEATARQVWRSAGCFHVVIGMQWRATGHAVLARRWLKSGRIMLDNSHGVVDPAPRVSPAEFLAAWWIDVSIEKRVGRDGEEAVPSVAAEWGEIRPL